MRDINRKKDVCAYLMKKSTTLSAAPMMGLAILTTLKRSARNLLYDHQTKEYFKLHILSWPI